MITFDLLEAKGNVGEMQRQAAAKVLRKHMSLLTSQWSNEISITLSWHDI